MNFLICWISSDGKFLNSKDDTWETFGLKRYNWLIDNNVYSCKDILEFLLITSVVSQFLLLHVHTSYV